MSVIILYVAMITAIIYGWQYFVEMKNFREGQEYSKSTLDWLGITGQILTSTVTKETRTREHSLGDMDGNSATNQSYWVDSFVYHIRIEYIYTVDGKSYDGLMVDIGEITDEKFAYDLARRHPEGSPITVYYDPQHPGDAVLTRNDGTQWDAIERLDRNLLIVKISIIVIVLVVIFRILT